ncbi:hypothetical protein [Natrialba sp. INN-245]|uniref:hypothetical protein n=1 Tax=Natrialba sp. INN-245 TaxID=2690967 RepID=UPI0013139F85|nr:hypothetical protein [Natrialba sp. INN-245]MWV41044.1 hypothetical protein [Natrialba sp. INN-245]
MLTLAILGGVLAVIGVFGSTMNKGGCAAEAAADTGPISIQEARRGTLGGQIETVMNFAGQNGKFLALLTIAGIIVLIEIAIATLGDLAQFTTIAIEEVVRFLLVVVTEVSAVLVIGVTAAGTFVYEHRAEIWGGIKTSGYYLRELIALIADLLTIATVGTFGAVKFWVIDGWQTR